MARRKSPPTAVYESNGAAPVPLPICLEDTLREDLTRANEQRHDWIEQQGRPQREVTRGSYRRMADFVVSTTDPDATIMLTKGEGHHLGYHTHYVVDGGKSRIILAALVTPSEVMENQPMLDLVFRARFRWKLWPRQITGDTAYGTIDNIVAVEDQHMRAYVPLPDFDKRTSVFGKQAFRYDPERDVYICPNNAILPLHTHAYNERVKRYQADAATCNACPLKAQCTTSDQGRVLKRSFDEEYLEQVRAYHATEPYQKAIRKRSVWVEPLFAEGKQWHGMRRFRLRLLWRVNCEALRIAAGQNLKRLLKKRGWGRRPYPAEAICVLYLAAFEWLTRTFVSLGLFPHHQCSFFNGHEGMHSTLLMSFVKAFFQQAVISIGTWSAPLISRLSGSLYKRPTQAGDVLRLIPWCSSISNSCCFLLENLFGEAHKETTESAEQEVLHEERAGSDASEQQDRQVPVPLPTSLSPQEQEQLVQQNAGRHDWIEELGAQDRMVTSRGYQRVADLQVSTTDPDATLMQTKNGADLGYHTHFVVDGGKSRIILHVLVTPSEVMDNQPMRDLLWRVRFRWKLWPRQVTGDRKYGTEDNLVAIEDQGIRAYIPLPDVDHWTEFFSSQEFQYDAERDIYVCPAGKELRFDRAHSTQRSRRYRARARDCNHCPLKVQCTTSKQGRSLCRSVDEACLDRVRAYQSTEAYKKALRKRQVWVEPLFAEAKDWHGMRHFRLRRLWRVNCEALGIHA